MTFDISDRLSIPATTHDLIVWNSHLLTTASLADDRFQVGTHGVRVLEKSWPEILNDCAGMCACQAISCVMRETLLQQAVIFGPLRSVDHPISVQGSGWNRRSSWDKTYKGELCGSEKSRRNVCRVPSIYGCWGTCNKGVKFELEANVANRTRAAIVSAAVQAPADWNASTEASPYYTPTHIIVRVHRTKALRLER